MTIDKDAALKQMGLNIKKYRELKGMTLEELASKCGYTTDNGRSSMSKIERGKNDLPTGKLKMIADALGISPAKLLDSSEEPAPVALSSSEENLVSMYRRLDQADQGRVEGFTEGLLSQGKYQTKEGSGAGAKIS